MYRREFLDQENVTESAVAKPRVTPADVEANIVDEWYVNAGKSVNAQAGGTDKIPDDSRLHCLTFCILLLRNGFVVTGESAVADSAQFDETLGRKVARKNAVVKDLEGRIMAVLETHNF